MSAILQWEKTEATEWSYSFVNCFCDSFAYRISALPDFSNPRFQYLCKEVDGRPGEVAKLQMTMLRQLHGLGSNWGMSLRLEKKDQEIILFLYFRHAGNHHLSSEEIEKADQRIYNALMKNEYSFSRVPSEEVDQHLKDVNWVTEIAEITKGELTYRSDQYPNGSYQEFYVPYMWLPADNSMESICEALLNHNGKAVVDITLVPSQYLEDEKEWVNGSLRRLKDCMNGETFRTENGRLLWQGQKLPILKTPIDNLEKLNKQYEISRVFISSIRVYCDEGAQQLSNSLLVNCTKSEGAIQVFRRGFGKFEYLVSCYQNIDVSADAHSAYWNQHSQTAPFRAQRLSRIVSLEEAANFFRIPIPNKPGFPGFGFDTGVSESKIVKSIENKMCLGIYLDEKGSQNNPAQFEVQQFAKHGLIVGVPGSGKTTAMFNILYQLWSNTDPDKRIPFIVLEPAKTEYRALKALDIFKDDMLVFSLGDEDTSPFRFNPMEVIPGIRLESHISKLQACFTGAFDLFDPLPIFLEQAIRRTYREKGWYDDSRGGDIGLETPTLSDLCRNAEYIVAHSGFDSKMRSDFQASLLERLNSLRRGSKGRMLDTKTSIPIEDLMGRPVILELDSLNGDEKSLIMMFLLSYVYEVCKANRRSGSPLKHMLLVEEAHNLIGAQGKGSDNRANPKEQTIELFVNMLAEMRALGQGILIADQLPTAIAPQAVKQTNVKILMRVTARDDREEIGNTMDLNEEQMHQVVNFKTGHAYLYHEGEDRVRLIRMNNFKGEHQIEEPPTDEELKIIMSGYETSSKEMYMPYEECKNICDLCNRRVRNQAESFVKETLCSQDIYELLFQGDKETWRNRIGICSAMLKLTIEEAVRIKKRYQSIGGCFGACVYIHILHIAENERKKCRQTHTNCECCKEKINEYISRYQKLVEEEISGTS